MKIKRGGKWVEVNPNKSKKDKQENENLRKLVSDLVKRIEALEGGKSK